MENPSTHQYTVSILSDRRSWINSHIEDLVVQLRHAGHEVLWVHDKSELSEGDFCFYLGCEQLIEQSILNYFEHNLVVHESLLPLGRGWSPLTWQILDGASEIPIVLFEAELSVDSGDIYLKDRIMLDGSELVDELRAKQGEKTISLVMRFLGDYKNIVKNRMPQTGISTYYEKRSPKDSRVNVDSTLGEIFQLLRVSDPIKYPCHFEINGTEYNLKIEKR